MTASKTREVGKHFDTTVLSVPGNVPFQASPTRTTLSHSLRTSAGIIVPFLWSLPQTPW